MSADPFVKVAVDNVANMANMGYLVLLKPEGQDVILPICIGPAEAQSIAAACNGVTFPRPITHDLFCTVMGELAVTVEEVRITALKNGTFYARLLLKSGEETKEIDCRPSDGIALAVREDAPIFVHDSVVEAAAVDAQQVAAASHPKQSKRGEKEEEPPKKPLTPEEQLKADLADAVADERYEDAARIRDDLNRMHKEQN